MIGRQRWTVRLVLIASWLAAPGVVADLVGGALAKAQPPPCEEGVECPWKLTVALENDNKLFGAWYYVSGGHDGNDYGRTHGLRLALAKTFAKGITAELELSTQLFAARNGINRAKTDAAGNVLYKDANGNRGYLRQDVYVDAGGRLVEQGRVVPQPDGSYADAAGQPVSALQSGYFSSDGQQQPVDAGTAAAVADVLHIGLVFNEINKLSLVVDNARQRQMFYWKGGVAVLVSNGSTITAGGSGQQRTFHRLRNQLFKGDYFEYDYYPSGGVDVGFSLLAAGGVDVPLWKSRLLTLLSRAEAGTLLSYLPGGVELAGTQLYGHLRLQLDVGRRDRRADPIFSLLVKQESNGYVTAPAFEAISRIETVFYTRPIDIFMSLNFYYANPVRAYYVYNENNSTMEFGLRGKMGR